MATYWEIAKEDWDDAVASMEINRYRPAVFYFQQFAEKGAKALLSRKDSYHNALKSHRIDTILAAYDRKHKCGDLEDKSVYLSNFYFDTRYPGDNYAEVIEAQVIKAHRYAQDLRKYYETELEKLDTQTSSEKLDVSSLPKLNG